MKVETLDLNGNPVSTVGEYEYDGDGKRVKKHVPATGEVTVFVYDAGGKLIGEYSTVAAPQSPKVSYATADHLGSPRILTDENGATISRRDFMPYGEEIATPERHPNLGYTDDEVRQKFTTYERDAESELDFAQARYFLKNHGRFSTPDPLMASASVGSPQSWNRYIYCENSPLVYVDPTGLFRWSEALGGNRSDRELQEELDLLAGLEEAEMYNHRIATLQAILASRREIVAALASARAAAASPFLNESERQEILAAIDAYGEPGVDNGVTVGVNFESRFAGQVHIEGSQIIVSLNLAQLSPSVLAHEGSHVNDAKSFLVSGQLHSVSWSASEYKAYRISALVSVGESPLDQNRVMQYRVVSGNGFIELWGPESYAGTTGTVAERTAQAKGTIPAKVNLHLSNEGISPGSTRGSEPAFPAKAPRWR